MRMLFLLAVVIVGLAVAGVLHFQKNGNSINITVDHDRLQEVEQQAAKAGADFFQKGEQALDNTQRTQR